MTNLSHDEDSEFLNC